MVVLPREFGSTEELFVCVTRGYSAALLTTLSDGLSSFTLY